jgi:hypothetical protein
MDKDPFLRYIFIQGYVEITDPCLYLFDYSPEVLRKKTKVLDFFNTDKKCFLNINIESSPPEIWIRIRFLEINGSPSLLATHKSDSELDLAEGSLKHSSRKQRRMIS